MFATRQVCRRLTGRAKRVCFSPGITEAIGAIPSMHIITRRRLNEFAHQHPTAKPGLQHWYTVIKSQSFSSFSELKAIFPNADQVGRLTVFNIGGNNFRLIAAIHYNRQKVYVRAILTHAEYDRGRWKE